MIAKFCTKGPKYDVKQPVLIYRRKMAIFFSFLIGQKSRKIVVGTSLLDRDIGYK